MIRSVPVPTIRQGLLLGVAAFLALLVTMPRTLNVYDEGIVLSDALRMLSGEIIHRDFYSLYGPAQYAIVAAIIDLTANSFLVARLYDLLIRAAILAVTYWIVGRVAARWIALGVTGVAGVWLMFVGNYLFPIFPCILLALLATWQVSRFAAAPAGSSRMAAAGALAGLAALFRYDAAAYLLVANLIGAGALAGWQAPRGRWLRHWLAGAAAYVGGAAAVFAPFALAYLAVAPIGAFLHDVLLFPLAYYPATRGLPFPGPSAIAASPSDAAVYLPFLAVALVLVWGVAERGSRVREMTAPAGPVVVAFGLATALLLLKGLVRVSPIHMMLAIVPALVVLAALAGSGWRGGAMRRLGAAAVLAVVVAPTLGAAWTLVATNLRIKDLSVGGWLLAHSGLPGTAFVGRACESVATTGFARVTPNVARVATYLLASTQPDDRILVGLDRTDKVFINAPSLYYMARRLPATHWHQYDPGLQTRADIQTAMIGELQQGDVRWVVRDATFDAVAEPNDSARSSGVRLLDGFVEAHYRPVAASGPIEVWLRNDVPAPPTPASACAAAPLS